MIEGGTGEREVGREGGRGRDALRSQLGGHSHSPMPKLQ